MYDSKIEQSNERCFGPVRRVRPLIFLYFREFRKKHSPSLLGSVSFPVPSQAAPNLPQAPSVLMQPPSDSTQH